MHLPGWATVGVALSGYRAEEVRGPHDRVPAYPGCAARGRPGAYPASVTRPTRLAALFLLPAALLAGCSHSGTPAADETADAEESVNSPEPVAGTPDPTVVPDITAAPAPTSTASDPADEQTDASGEPEADDQLTPQGLDQPAGLDDGLAVQIGALRATDLTAGPGEIGGAGIIVPVTVGNNTNEEMSLSGLVVNVSYGADGVPASPVESASDALPASLSPGQAIVVEYAFVVPVDERGSVSVTVDPGADSRAAVFQGEAPTS